MKFVRYGILVALGLSVMACHTTNDNPNVPVAGAKYSVIQTQNLRFGRVGRLVLKPNNRVDISTIDGKGLNIVPGRSIQVAPGKHTVAVVCTSNGRVFGKNILRFSTLPGHVYTISYPEYMHGYHFDANACDKLVVM